jgi:hypothetical protein
MLSESQLAALKWTRKNEFEVVIAELG